MQSPSRIPALSSRSACLYAVTDASWLGGRTLDECVLEAVEGGATFVQLRDKHASTCDLVEQCGRLRRVIPGDVPFVINDDLRRRVWRRPTACMWDKAMPPAKRPRRVLGPEKIVGVSADSRIRPLRRGCPAPTTPRRGGAVQNGLRSPRPDVLPLATLSDICRSVDYTRRGHRRP